MLGAVKLAQERCASSDAAVVSATGLAAIAAIVQKGVEPDTVVEGLSALVGGAENGMAGQELDRAAWGCHGLAIVMAPGVDFEGPVQEVVGARNVEYSHVFDRAALDEAVRLRTLGLVKSAFSGPTPANVCVVVSVVNVFASKWEHALEPMARHVFTNKVFLS
jgi:hypothetical protein